MNSRPLAKENTERSNIFSRKFAKGQNLKIMKKALDFCLKHFIPSDEDSILKYTFFGFR